MVDSTSDGPLKRQPQTSILVFLQGQPNHQLTKQHVSRVFSRAGLDPSNGIDVPEWAWRQYGSHHPDSFAQAWTKLLHPLLAKQARSGTRIILVLRLPFAYFEQGPWDPIEVCREFGHVFPDTLGLGPDARHILIAEEVPIGKLHEGNTLPTPQANFFLLKEMEDGTPSLPEAFVAARLEAHLSHKPMPSELVDLPPVPQLAPPPQIKTAASDATTRPALPRNIRTQRPPPPALAARRPEVSGSYGNSDATSSDDVSLLEDAPAELEAPKPAVPPPSEHLRPKGGYGHSQTGGRSAVRIERIAPRPEIQWPQRSSGSSHPPPRQSGSVLKPDEETVVVKEAVGSSPTASDKPLNPDKK